MKIYIDTNNFECHVTNPDGLFQEIEDNYFDGKCDAFIEGTRYVPFGEKWIRDDGKVFTGKMISPCKLSTVRDAAQAQYEADLAEAAAAYQEGVYSAYDQ